MENLNAEQVKRALECLQDEDNIFCNTKCPYYDYLCKTYHCERAVGRDALALINSQEQRIGELEKRLRYLLQSKTIAEYDEVDIHTKEYVKDIHSLDANIKGLTEELTRKETEYNELYELCESYRIERDAMRGAANSYKMYSKTLEKENETLKTLLDESYDTQNSLTEENERLIDELAKSYEALDEAVSFYCSFTKSKIQNCPIDDEVAKAKTDTVRNMQERLDKHFCHDPAFLGVEQRLIMDVIDQIAKEMLGGENEN